MLYFDILVSCQPQLQTPFLRLEGVLLRQLPLYFISFQLNHSLSLVFWSVNDQSRCVWLDMSYLLHFVLNQTNKKWRLQDWSGKALERDSRYLIHQVRTRYFNIFLISNLCLQNTILGQWLDQVGLIHYLGKLYFSLFLTSLPCSRFLDVTQRSPRCWGSIAWHPKNGCKGD